MSIPLQPHAGNIGINIGAASATTCFLLPRWKDSCFGDLHGQERDAIEFYTDKKVVIEHWGDQHSGKL